MNLPNKLTVLRVLLIPAFVLFALWSFWAGNTLIALAIFAIASLTDMLDGKIARKQGIVTNFGKFLDPLADKALVMAALLVMVQKGWVDSVAVMIILFREFMVSGLRMIASSGEGVVIAAGWFGKVKTAFTMVAICAIFTLHGLADLGVGIGADFMAILDSALIWIAAVITALSGWQYLWSYRKLINPND